MKAVLNKYAATIIFLLTFSIFFNKAVFGYSDGDEADPNYAAYLDDIVIIPSGSEERIFDSFRSITVADIEDIENKNQDKRSDYPYPLKNCYHPFFDDRHKDIVNWTCLNNDYAA